MTIGNNFGWEFMHDKLVHIYAFFNNKSTYYYADEQSKPDAHPSQLYQLAFNLFKPSARDELSKACELRPIAQYRKGDGECCQGIKQTVSR
jgi:hypothetical protein